MITMIEDNNTPAHFAVAKMISSAGSIENLVNILICENSNVYSDEEVEHAEMILLHAGVPYLQINKDRVEKVRRNIIRKLHHSFSDFELKYIFDHYDRLPITRMANNLKRDHTVVSRIVRLIKERFEGLNTIKKL